MSQQRCAGRGLGEIRYERLQRALQDAFEELARRVESSYARFSLDSLADARVEFLERDLPRDWERYLAERGLPTARREVLATSERPRFIDWSGQPRRDALRGALSNRARDRTIDALRRHRRELPLSLEDERSPQPARELLAPVRWEDRVLERADARALAPRLIAAVAPTGALRTGLQGLVGVYMLGLERREVAAALGVPDSTLGVYLGRSAARMRAEAERLGAAA